MRKMKDEDFSERIRERPLLLRALKKPPARRNNRDLEAIAEARLLGILNRGGRR